MGELTVEVARGSSVESRHEVDAVLIDGAGTVEAWGDAGRAVLPRSAVKPIQGLPLITTGAAAAYELDDSLLALACASHGGEPMHVVKVTGWLDRLGLGVGALECGGHPPTHRPSADDLVATGMGPDARHDNCSGKHCGFLTVCAHLGIEAAGYPAPDHPLQRDHVTPVLAEVCGVDLGSQEPAVDGCGIPLWSLPLRRLAEGWRRLATDRAGRRLLDAMAAHPELVGGTDRADSRMMAEGRGRVVVKPGAEGVACGVDLETGSAFALKARDGATRAADAATEWLLARTGARPAPEPHEVRNRSGSVVGAIRVVG